MIEACRNWKPGDAVTFKVAMNRRGMVVLHDWPAIVVEVHGRQVTVQPWASDRLGYERKVLPADALKAG